MNGGTGKSVPPSLYPVVRGRQGLLYSLLHTRTRQRSGPPLFTCQIGFLHGTGQRVYYLVSTQDGLQDAQRKWRYYNPSLHGDQTRFRPEAEKLGGPAEVLHWVRSSRPVPPARPGVPMRTRTFQA